MTVVDASVMVSALHPADINHDLCRRWLSEQLTARTPLVGPYLLLSEIAGSITRVTGQSSAGHTAVATVLAIPTFTFVSYLDEAPT